MHSSSEIHLLPEHIIDQIKAGEVIERPSTLVKEVLENSIDAGATELNLHLIENGLELISLQDDGKGISASELPLAFCRHATSKIDRFDDIYRLSSYGFRGEALASIASIAKVSCESQTSSSRGKITIEGGETLNHHSEEAKSLKTGTNLYVKDLFFNTPVRMKFIQSKTSEKNQLKKIINSFLLTHHDKTFSIKWDERERQFYPAAKDKVQRIKEALFKQQDIEFEQISAQYDGVSIDLYLSQQSKRGNAHKAHYIFVNDRYINEIALHKLILNSASYLWPEGETGHYVAFISLPADEIDVNVHPNKTQVKFFRPSKLFSLVSGAIKAHQTSHHAPVVSPEPQGTFLKGTDSQKTMNYREVDFNLPQESQNYLNSFHQNTQYATSSPPLILNQGEFYFIQREDGVHLLQAAHLVNFHILHLLNSVDPNQIVPLLVSRPIDKKTRLTDSQIEKLQELGFELDYFDDQGYIARTFYQPLQNYPYLSILSSLMEHNITANQCDFYQDFKDFKLKLEQVQLIISELGYSRLQEQGIIKPLSLQQLKQLYGKV